MAFGRSILHAARQDRFRRAREFINRTWSPKLPCIAFQHLKQTPSLALVTLGVQNAFPFEVDVIDKGVTSLWRFRQALELLLHVCSIGRRRFGQHFRQRASNLRNKKFCLKIDRIGQKPA